MSNKTNNILNFRSPEKNFSFQNISKTQAQIDIYAPIGDSWDGSYISAKMVSNALKEMDDTINTINVRINSPGGDVFHGISIYNMLKNSGKKIKVYVDGIAASIASIIALAGDEVMIGDGAMFMIHKPMTFAWGNSHQFMATIERLDDIENQLVSIYKKNTNLTVNEIKDYISGNNGDGTYFDADQSIEHGFASSKMDEEEIVDMAACLERAPWIRNKESLLKNQKKAIETVDKVIKDIEGFIAR